jgi:hypothetical protein
MDISETYLTVGAAAFELGMPVAAVIALAFAPRMRKFAALLLGAVTPLLLAYVLVAGSYFFATAEPSGRFPFSAVWMMSFVVYLALAIVGAVLAFIPKPSNLYVRYFVGFLSAPMSYALLSLIS